MCVALGGALRIRYELPQAAPCTICSDLQCSTTCFLQVLSFFHAPWSWTQGKERFRPCQVPTTQGTRTQVVRRRRLPGARCTVHGATPAGHGLDHFDGGSGGGGGGLGCKLYGTNAMGEDHVGSVAHPVTPSIEDRGAVPHQIILTLVAGGGGWGANPTAPTLWEKTMSAVWRIRSLHLSRTEARYLTPHLVDGVPWEDVWATAAACTAHCRGLCCHHG